MSGVVTYFRTSKNRSFLLLVVTSTLALLTLLDSPAADAAPPRAGFNMGLGSRFLTGELGNHAQRGIGLNVSQELRGDYFGVRLELGASYFLTQQPTPPLAREFELYTVALGPQLHVPIGPTEIVVGIDYRHVGLVENSLVEFTGPELNHGAAGGTVEVRYRMAPFEVMLRSGFHPIFGLDGSIFSVDLAVGLATD